MRSIWVKTTYLISYCSCILFINNSSFAISYQFSASSGTFTPNSSPTVVYSAGVDDAFSGSIPIGFTFNYGGCTTTPYTTINLSSNGVLSLGAGLTGTVAANNLTTTTQGKLIAPLWDDLQVGTGGSVNYKTTGAVGSRVFTVEWLNMEWSWSAGSAGISFQVKLYEANGKIEFVYRQEAGALLSPSASIGINGAAAGDYYSLNSTGVSPSAVYGTETNNLSLKPATGQIYSWDLPGTMTYVSSSVTQAGTADVYPNTINNEITGIQIVVSGGCTPFNLTQLLINMNGTTAIADVSNIDVYYTGNSSTYAPATLFGSVAPGAGTLTVNGSQVLQNGTNYFWVVYDIPSTATLGNFLDAECTQITMSGTGGTQTPSGNPPVGNRPIVAEPPSFAKWIELGWARAVVEASGSTGLVWAGQTTNTYSSGSGDAYFIKTNYDLSTIYWTSVAGFAGGSERINDIVETADGFVGIGYTTSAGAGSWDIFVVKINTAGAVQWTKTIGTASTEEGFGITKTSDGHIAICGYRGDFVDGYFAKIDNTNGNILAQRSINATGSTYLRAIIQTADGGFLMGGNTNNDFYLVKLTSTFTLDWARSWGGGSNDYIQFVTENAANDYTVGGYTYSFGAGGRDGYVMRFTWGGSPSVTWVNAYGTADGNSFNDGLRNSDGSYITTGITTRSDDPLNDEAFVAKISSTGSIVFSKSIGTTIISEDQEGYGISALADGNFAAAGLHNNAIGANFYMMKVAGSGYSCASIQDNGGITNLVAPAFTTTGSIATPAFSSTSQSPTLNTGGVIAPDGCTVTLPVELLRFWGNAHEGVNKLEWVTSNEINNDYFILESSNNGLNWFSIGTIQGAGNSSIVLNYSFSDYEPFFPLTYYRLRQTDFDGKFIYTETIAIETEKINTNNSIGIYPNPVHAELGFSFNSKHEDIIIVEVHNMLGETVILKSYNTSKGNNRFLLDITSLSNDIYILTIKTKSFSENKKFIKQ